MAHRHKMQARARGGKAFAEGGRTVYTGAGSNVAKEAGSKSEDFKRGGGIAVGRAFGGGVSGRADKRKRGGGVKGFASGGSVWSKAAGGIRGQKGMAQAVNRPTKLHDEPHDGTVKAAGDGAHDRSGHGGKARHQLKTGGVARGFKHGGHVKKEEDDGEEDEEEGEDEEDCRALGGGVTTFKRGGGLKMHYVGGGGHHQKRAQGGSVEPDGDEGYSRGGSRWMEKAFANSHGQFKAKAHKAGMSTEGYAKKEANSPNASTKTKRQANLAKLGAKYGGG